MSYQLAWTDLPHLECNQLASTHFPHYECYQLTPTHSEKSDQIPFLFRFQMVDCLPGNQVKEMIKTGCHCLQFKAGNAMQINRIIKGGIN